MKHGAIFITSGIINTKEQDVYNAISANPEFEIIETTYQGEWVSITARRK
jgi:ribosomal protein L11 methyltransferase